MRVKNLTSLRPATTAGGTTADWITRFATYNAGKTPGNGHILYAGMESVLGQPPTFFAGDTKRARLFMTYQQDTPIRGSYTPAGVITLHVPATALAEAPTATTSAQRTLYSATAFTATTLAASKAIPKACSTSPTPPPPSTASLLPIARAAPAPPAEGRQRAAGPGPAEAQRQPARAAQQVPGPRPAVPAREQLAGRDRLGLGATDRRARRTPHRRGGPPPPHLSGDRLGSPGPGRRVRRRNR